MRVVFDTANDQGFAVMNPQHLREVCMHFAAQYLIAQKRKPVFG
jgi:hypothetical protein